MLGLGIIMADINICKKCTFHQSKVYGDKVYDYCAAEKYRLIRHNARIEQIIDANFEIPRECPYILEQTLSIDKS